MLISVFNRSGGDISNDAAQHVIGAINRQIREDFVPHWGVNGVLQLEMEGGSPEGNYPERGGAAIYIGSQRECDDAISHHLRSFAGVPFGSVLPELSSEFNQEWSVLLSHQTLALLNDPEANRMVMGPHPTEDRSVFHCFELCDAVQAQSYTIDGVDLSNFLLPGYFSATRTSNEARCDFLGSLDEGERPLPAFGVHPGGYIGFYDPILQRHDIWSIKGDSVAHGRLIIESTMGLASRTMRYQSPDRRNRIERELSQRSSDRPVGKRRTHAKASPLDYESLWRDYTNRAT